MRLSDALEALTAQLARHAGQPPVIEHIRSTPWASVTFSGARHRVTLRFDGDGAGDALARMSEHLDYAEFELGDHILADIELIECECADGMARAVIEALTVSES